jgi:hypothetical protein
MPPMPAAADAQFEAAVTAVWSTRVQQLVGRFEDVLRDIIKTGLTISDARKTKATGRETSIDTAREYRELQRLKQALFETENIIPQQIAAESPGEHDGHAEVDPSRRELPQ